VIKETMFPELTDPDGFAAFSRLTYSAEEWEERHAVFFDAQYIAAQQQLSAVGIHGQIDELAVMVFTTAQEYELIEKAVRNGWSVFNSAEDSVETYPIASNYNVHYTFLRHPAKPYRLEVMRQLEGFSPLHITLAGRAIEAGWNKPIVVHASFKVGSVKEFGEAEAKLLDSGDLILSQGCRSTYGVFAYYAPTIHADDSFDLQVYLKPRVNLRDQA
jgi:hypothetical protein